MHRGTYIWGLPLRNGRLSGATELRCSCLSQWCHRDVEEVLHCQRLPANKAKAAVAVAKVLHAWLVWVP